LTRRAVAALLPSLAALLAAEGEPTAASLKQSLSQLGLEFTDAQLDMMLPGVKRALASYSALRTLNIPLDTDPCYTFSPVLPGMRFEAGKAEFRPSKATPGTWKDLEDLAFRPVTELSVLLRRRKVTSTELTRLYLDRLKRYSPKLLCVITLTEDLAVEQAKQADAEIRRGKYRGPLHGIPYGAKDLFATKGYKTTWGAEPFQEQTIDADATVITRMREAGAVLLAKLSMGALAQGGLWFGGMTKTPWNIEQTSSGSSAGSASATAAGLAAFALGTETLGSIISPSVRCGVTGLRPTFGRVPRTGAMALSWTMDKIGPICRSVEDCMLVLRALDGPDGQDLSSKPSPALRWQPKQPLARLKVGVLRDGMRPEQIKAIEALGKLGVELIDTKLPEFPIQAVTTMLIAEAATAFDDITRDGRVNQLSGQRAGDWPNSFRTARLIPAVEYIRAARARTLLMRTFHDYFGAFDALVSSNSSPCLGITNLTGHPQIVAPCGFPRNESGKTNPIGLLFTGKLYQEGELARLAFAYQQATSHHQQWPPLE
jgi:Asp-tRNA(Asn)/Glu-tRNA(Gln) amidotransferase A subunit family amidase